MLVLLIINQNRIQQSHQTNTSVSPDAAIVRFERDTAIKNALADTADRMYLRFREFAVDIEKKCTLCIDFTTVGERIKSIHKKVTDFTHGLEYIDINDATRLLESVEEFTCKINIGVIEVVRDVQTRISESRTSVTDAARRIARAIETWQDIYDSYVGTKLKVHLRASEIELAAVRSQLDDVTNQLTRCKETMHDREKCHAKISELTRKLKVCDNALSLLRSSVIVGDKYSTMQGVEHDTGNDVDDNDDGDGSGGRRKINDETKCRLFYECGVFMTLIHPIVMGNDASLNRSELHRVYDHGTRSSRNVITNVSTWFDIFCTLSYTERIFDTVLMRDLCRVISELLELFYTNGDDDDDEEEEDVDRDESENNETNGTAGDNHPKKTNADKEITKHIFTIPNDAETIDAISSKMRKSLEILQYVRRMTGSCVSFMIHPIGRLCTIMFYRQATRLNNSILTL